LTSLTYSVFKQDDKGVAVWRQLYWQACLLLKYEQYVQVWYDN